MYTCNLLYQYNNYTSIIFFKVYFAFYKDVLVRTNIYLFSSLLSLYNRKGKSITLHFPKKLTTEIILVALIIGGQELPVVQWFRICLAMQRTQFQSLPQELKILHAAGQANPHTTTTEPRSGNERARMTI